MVCNRSSISHSPEAALKAKILEVHRRLVELYGEKVNCRRLDPLSQLISTILSQNTNDALRDKAYARLRERFPTWEAVRDAPLEEVEEAIRIAGLSTQKAARIQEVLRRITEERGKLELSFLKDWPLEEARRWLMSFKGVGPKTAAIVLLFALGMPAFPVDTHIFRVSKRLGLLPPNTTRERAHRILEGLVPPEHFYTFHINMIEHGRRVCVARSPRCTLCRLRDLCEFHLARG